MAGLIKENAQLQATANLQLQCIKVMIKDKTQLRDKGAPAGPAKSKVDGELLALTDKEAPAGPAKSKADGELLAICDVDRDVGCGKVDAATLTSLETLTQNAKYWGSAPLPPVPVDVLNKAIECEKMGRHRAGPWFTIEQSSYGTPYPEWGWISKVQARGCHQFGNVAARVLARGGGQWKLWSEGKVFCNARLVCQRCTCMKMISTDERLFTNDQDEELMNFFMEPTTAYPQALLR